jgi:Amt family ammonium transporter
MVRLLVMVCALVPGMVIGAEEEVSSIDRGDTAWIMVSTALVLFMSLPGLAFFYGGLVHKRNVLSVLMQCFAIASLMSVIWALFGYSLAFSGGMGGAGWFLGGFDHLLMSSVVVGEVSGTIPLFLHFGFQMTFFIITPALMVGAYVERMKFSAVMWFSGIWAVLVYLPVCHMVWAEDGLFYRMGVIDLAGGVVVHITAGVGALVACIVVGPRTGYPKTPFMPHNLPMTVCGTGMLWVGWYGFNGGSFLAADGNGVLAMVVTHISASVASLTWSMLEWRIHGKSSVLGFVTGAVAGLAAITPSAGETGPLGALIIGTVAGAVCFWASTSLKKKLNYDDSLDVFGVHGVGGIVGTFLVAFLASSRFGGKRLEESHDMISQMGVQSAAILGVAVYTAILSWIILKGVGLITRGLRVSEQEENAGLDISSHGESAYND